MSSVAVIFHRLGPYHFARLRAAGKVLPVVAVETSGTDETYAWDKVAGADGFKRVTLFENADAQKQPKSEVTRRMGAMLDKIQPQVVVIPGWSDAAALAALQWSLKHQVPAVIMSESTERDEARKPWKELIKRRIVALGSAALAGGTPHKDYLVKLGMPAERIFLGYDAVDNGYFEDKAAEIRNQKSEIRNPYGLTENYFLASNRFIEKKNLTRLIEAYARYRELASKSEIRTQKSKILGLVLLGDGALRSSLETQVSRLGLQHCVVLPGFKQYPELPEYYARADAFIHASTTEQWGLVVNEAMASSLPVLVSNRCGCAQDLVQEGKNGFTFDPYNVEQLASLMLKISSFKTFSSPPRPGRGIQGEVSNESLADFGTESARIIADWGPERFAQGLKAAAEKALAVGPVKATGLQKIILKVMRAK